MLLETIKRDLLVAYRNPAEMLNPLVFFVIVISLFPLGISPMENVLRGIAPGVIWVAALLATLLSMDLIFRSDFEDGSLEQMTLTQQPLLLIVGGKIISHWLMTGLPLTLLSPLLALMLFVDRQGIEAIVLSLLLGTPILSLLGAVGASLTVGLQKGGVLIAILILPLYVPVLILATEMIKTGMAGGDYSGHMLWLGAILALSIGVAPLASSAGVKISLSH
ncbi:MAG: heme exporter protein CcmB [Proteobacteria bacterium]|nr:heme exporter protein CcmB [Pseudomonadota bacterium]